MTRLDEPPRRLARGRYVAAWSPDGDTIAVSAYLAGRVFFFDRAGHEQRSITLPGDYFWAWDLDWSPAGDRLLLTSSDEAGRVTIRAVRPDGQELVTVMEDSAEIATARWAPRGDAIYYSRRANQTVSILTLPMQGGLPRPGAVPVTLLDGLEMDRSFGITSDGRQLVYARAPYHSNLWLVELGEKAGGQPVRTRQLTWGTSLVERPRVSPDGSLVLFNIGRESRANLFAMPIEGGAPRQITTLDGFTVGGVWSPDGKQIAFASMKDGITGVWAVGAAGGPPRMLPGVKMSDTFDLAWHPGTHVLVQQPGNRDYVEVDDVTRATRPLVRDRSVGWVFSPVSSPDRRQVAVTWNRRDGRGLWVIDRMAGQERLVYPTRAGTLRPIGWSADGREIYAVEAKGGVYRGLVLPQGDTMTDARILRIAIGGGPAYPVVTLPFEEIGSVSMSGDGRRFVCTVYASESDVWIVDLPDEPREEL